MGCDPGACPTSAFAMDAYMFDATMGGTPSADIQHLIYGGGFGTPACFAPHGDSSKCGGYNVDIILPTSKLTPGTYSLVNSDVDMLIEETADEGGGSCSGAAAGSLESGTLIIHSIDAQTVTFSVEDVEQILDIPVNGFFQASRCVLEY